MARTGPGVATPAGRRPQTARDRIDIIGFIAPIDALHGISPQGSRKRGALPSRRQRRGQVHPDQHHGRLSRPERGAGSGRTAPRKGRPPRKPAPPEKRKGPQGPLIFQYSIGRSERIRTSDPCLPKTGRPPSFRFRSCFSPVFVRLLWTLLSLNLCRLTVSARRRSPQRSRLFGGPGGGAHRRGASSPGSRRNSRRAPKRRRGRTASPK